MRLSKKFVFRFLFLVIILSALVGSLSTFAVINFQEKSSDELVKDYYLSENAVQVSPHHIRKGMAKGDDSFILVDLRSEEEYLEEHIVGAVNIPAYKSRYKSAYGDVERIVNSFEKLIEENPDKDIIIYCYSIPCMTGSKVGKMLIEHDIYVQKLGIGWNEWRYFWTLWNHPHEWNTTNVEDYVIAGSAPGEVREDLVSKTCPIKGEFGC